MNESKRTHAQIEARRRYSESGKYKHWRDKRSARRQRHLNRYKKRVGCASCGYNDNHHALQFDHIIPKRNRYAKRVGQLLLGSLSRLFAEIRECQVLCANCHRIKTASEEAERLANETSL